MTEWSDRGWGRPTCIAMGMLMPYASSTAGAAGPAYAPIKATMQDTIVTLTGHDLTLDQLLEVARYGAKVKLSDDAKRRQADNYGLLLEAQAEAVPVYLLNRGGGLGRATVTLEGDPLSPENKAALERRELAAFEQGSAEGDGPEIDDEALIRAAMVIRANGMVFETPSPPLSQRLLDLLNDDITPVVQSHGSVGESDLYVLANISGTMVGRGDAYYRGVRMPAAQALRRAGLAPLKPFALDSSTLANSNAYSTALAALLVGEGRQALDWTDLTDAIDLNGMNGSITPLSTPVQMKRPGKWLKWDADRLLDMLKGGYLFEDDPQRLLADPDSLRASSIRQAAAWAAWDALRAAVTAQMNSSDHNPVVSVGLSPQDSWELSTPQMMRYYVKGGEYSHGQHGYIVSSANWDPYPLVNEVEAFTNALANVAVAVTQRRYRFDNPFFTVIKPSDVLPAGDDARAGSQGSGTLAMHWWQELQVLAAPVAAEGVATDAQGNGDIESQAVIKATRARQAVDVMMHLVAQDLLTGAFWMSLRELQNPSRRFGDAPERAVAALRRLIPLHPSVGADARREISPAVQAYEFVTTTPAAAFYPPALQQPGGRVDIPQAN